MLRERGVVTTERRGWFVGAGSEARTAWAVFRAVVEVPVDQEFVRDGVTCRVVAEHEGDVLWLETSRTEALPREGWRSEGHPPEPTVFRMDFRRVFTFEDEAGEYIEMNELLLCVEFPDTPELASQDGIHLEGRGGPPADGDDRRAEPDADPRLAAKEWAAAVERADAFKAAFGGHAPSRFYFTQSDY
jgi:hypothetical protein